MTGSRWAALLLLVIAGCTPRGGDATADAETEAAAPHRLTVLVRSGSDGPEVVDLAVAPHDGSADSKTGRGDSESDGPMLSLHDAGGNVVHTVPLSSGAAPLSFVDRAHPGRPEALQGGLDHEQGALQVLTLPLAAEATHLGSGEGRPRISIRHDGPDACPPCVREPILLHPDIERDPAMVLDIVIVGDGFREDELDWFSDRARFLSEHILGSPPFDRHTDKIQIHLLPTVSVDSGVDRPHEGKELDTCLGLTGGSGGCCGTDTPDRLWQALGCRFPIWQVDLRVVIANVPEYGGRGHADIKAAYVDAYTRGEQEKFVNVALHEMAHALAGLGDEYMGCEPVEMKPEFANVASADQIRAQAVPWSDLATPDELDAEHNLRYVYEVTAEQKDSCSDEMPRVPEELTGKLGLFWGAMFVDGTDSICNGCNVYSDPRGGNYYRPMAHCKMRHVMDDFCRACERAIEEAILQASGEGRDLAAGY